MQTVTNACALGGTLGIGQTAYTGVAFDGYQYGVKNRQFKLETNLGPMQSSTKGIAYPKALVTDPNGN
jgi:hypothetical protein